MMKFKFNLGDKVNVMEGWELPLYKGQVVNRRQYCLSASGGYNYVNEYHVRRLEWSGAMQGEMPVDGLFQVKEEDLCLVG